MNIFIILIIKILAFSITRIQGQNVGKTEDSNSGNDPFYNQLSSDVYHSQERIILQNAPESKDSGIQHSDYSNIEIIAAPIITDDEIRRSNQDKDNMKKNLPRTFQTRKSTANDLTKNNFSKEFDSILKPSAKGLKLISSLMPSRGGNFKELLDLDGILTALIKNFEKPQEVKAENIQEKIFNEERKNSFLYDIITSASHIRPMKALDIPVFPVLNGMFNKKDDDFSTFVDIFIPNGDDNIGTPFIDLFSKNKDSDNTRGPFNLFNRSPSNSLFNNAALITAENNLAPSKATTAGKKAKDNIIKKKKSNSNSKIKKSLSEPGITSEENVQKLTEAIHKFKKIIKVVGELDSYFTGIFKTYIKKLAQLCDENEKNIDDNFLD